MNKDIVPRAPSAPPAPLQQIEDNAPLASDYIIPYMIITQGTSEAFQQKKADTGDVIRSTTFEKLGDGTAPVEIVLLSNPASKWVIEQRPAKNARYEFRSEIQRNAANETLPWSYWADAEGNEVPEGTKGAFEWKRTKVLKFFAILFNDLKADAEEAKKADQGEIPDLNKVLMPVVISFRSTSYRAGKLINNIIGRAKSAKVAVWKYSVPLGVAIESNDQGTYYVWTVEENKTKPLPAEFLPKVKNWVDIVNSGNALKTDDEAESESPSSVREVVDAETRESVC